jgi:deoxyribose-phosphate aldolase
MTATHDTPHDAAGLARYVDHTLLKPEATVADVQALVEEAARLGVYSVCVSPSFLPLDTSAAPGLHVATVCGFPSGKHHSDVKAAEAARSVRDGADEVDMVIDVGAAREGRYDAVELMARTVGGRLGVKATGGIRTTADAVAMVQAGATRLGLSGTAAGLAGLEADAGY